ncbi:MAG: DUF3108 domain-containing protein [Desulfomonile sp.]|nr:DUF3108 domain-containing protein [Deltaproteobacteria bacterium]
MSGCRQIAREVFPVLVLSLFFSFFTGISAAIASGRSELLRYEVTWNGNKAGHGDITTKRESDRVNVIAQAVSDGFLKAVMEIWSRVQATFSAHTFKPVFYEFHLKSNVLRHESVDLAFDHDAKTVQVNKQRGNEKESHSEKFAAIYDPVTAIFLLRSQRHFDKPMYVDIFDGKDRSRLLVHPAGSEYVKTKAGQHRALVLNLRLVKLGGDKKEIAAGRLWISDDQHRIPLLLTSSPIVGTIRLELVQAQL